MIFARSRATSRRHTEKPKGRHAYLHPIRLDQMHLRNQVQLEAVLLTNQSALKETLDVSWSAPNQHALSFHGQFGSIIAGKSKC